MYYVTFGTIPGFQASVCRLSNRRSQWNERATRVPRLSRVCGVWGLWTLVQLPIQPSAVPCVSHLTLPHTHTQWPSCGGGGGAVGGPSPSPVYNTRRTRPHGTAAAGGAGGTHVPHCPSRVSAPPALWILNSGTYYCHTHQRERR